MGVGNARLRLRARMVGGTVMLVALALMAWGTASPSAASPLVAEWQ